jgi:hypothetical protein
MSTYESAQSALQHLNPNLPRNEWLKIGLSAKAAGLSFDDFHAWSVSAGNYKDISDCKKVWNEPPKNITKGYLFKAAQDKGWINTGDGVPTNSTKKPYFDNPVDWFNSLPEFDSHPYIEAQGLTDAINGYKCDLRQGKDKGGAFIAYPLKDLKTGKTTGFNRIYGKGKDGKKLAPKTAKKGNAGIIGKLSTDTQKIYIAEGMADAIHAHHAYKSPCLIANDAGNLPAVAENTRKKYPNAEIIIIADNDKAGVSYAKTAAQKSDGKIIVDIFSKDLTESVLNGRNISQLKPDANRIDTVKIEIETANEPDILIKQIVHYANLTPIEIGEVKNLICKKFGIGKREINESFSVYKKEEKREAYREAIEGKESDADKPTVETNTYRVFTDLSNTAKERLINNNDNNPHIFNAPNGLSRLIFSTTVNGVMATLGTMDSKALWHELNRVARWVSIKVNKESGEVSEHPCPCPMNVADDILFSTNFDAFPPLTRIITAPCVTKNESIIFNEGYHKDSKTYYHKETDIEINEIEPTEKNVKFSVDLIDEMLIDFPFDSQASKANAIACLILPFVRDLIDGATPLHYFSAPAPGTGKTLLAESVASVFNPAVSISTAPKGRNPESVEEEWRKKISTFLMAARSHVVIDNAKGRIDSSNLESVLTSTSWTDRQLGGNTEITVPNKVVWELTGNNAELSEDLSRRVIEIRLDANVEKPAERGEEAFKHPNLKKWISKNRGRLITAVLTIVKSWLKNGKPKPNLSQKLGSFEEYTYTIGGILENAGISGFLDNREQTKNRVNSVGDIFAGVIDVWAKEFGVKTITSSELYTALKANYSEIFEENGGFISNKGDKGENIRVGNWLTKNTDKIINNHKIIKSFYGTRPQYSLQQVKTTIEV